MGCTYLSLPLIPASGTEVLIQALWYTLMNWVVWFWKRLFRLRPSHYDFTKGNVSSISPSGANLSDLFSLQNTKYFNQNMYTKIWSANGSHLCCPGLNALTFHCRSCIYTHYIDVIVSDMVSQITGASIVCSTVCSGIDQRKHQSSAPLAIEMEIHRWPVNFPHKGPVTRKMFPFDDVIMGRCIWSSLCQQTVHHQAQWWTRSLTHILYIIRPKLVELKWFKTSYDHKLFLKCPIISKGWYREWQNHFKIITVQLPWSEFYTKEKLWYLGLRRFGEYLPNRKTPGPNYSPRDCVYQQGLTSATNVNKNYIHHNVWD